MWIMYFFVHWCGRFAFPIFMSYLIIIEHLWWAWCFDIITILSSSLPHTKQMSTEKRAFSEKKFEFFLQKDRNRTIFQNLIIIFVDKYILLIMYEKTSIEQKTFAYFWNFVFHNLISTDNSKKQTTKFTCFGEFLFFFHFSWLT